MFLRLQYPLFVVLFILYVNRSVSESDFVIVNDGPELQDDGCHFLLTSFAAVSANFTHCVISNARPINLCEKCVDSYVLSIEVHKDILKLENEAGQLCKEKLLNLDRLAVVEGAFNYISGLWKRAACDSCYNLSPDGNPEKLKPIVKDLLKLQNETSTCILEHRNDTLPAGVSDPLVCTECKDLYLGLNYKYNHAKDDIFCMDMIDMVNNTRQEWSVTLGCCLDRQKPELFFLVSSGVISVVPVIFYLAACSFAGRKEQKVLLKKRVRLPSLNSLQAANCDTHNTNAAEEDVTVEGNSSSGMKITTTAEIPPVLE